MTNLLPKLFEAPSYNYACIIVTAAAAAAAVQTVPKLELSADQEGAWGVVNDVTFTVARETPRLMGGGATYRVDKETPSKMG